jgi:hypothetical protein
LRFRSPAMIASSLLVACALCLLGVALAVGGPIETQQSRLDSVAIAQHSLSSRPHHAAIRGREALADGRGRRAAGRRPLSRARPAKGAIALRRAAPRGNSGGSARPAKPTPIGSTPPPAAAGGSPLAPAPAPVGPPTPVLPADGSLPALYWGASIGSQLTGVQAPWDMGAVTEFEQIAGKKVSLVNFFSPFANCPPSGGACSFYKFPTEPMESIRAYGAIPVFSWSSQSIPSSKEEPNFQLSDVIAGTYDPYIREFAEAAKTWDHPFFMRFDWEMNGSWFPWSEGVNGNQSGEFIAAWRHVHDIFAAVGADNVTWVWCPNVDPDNTLLDLAGQYPGDAYVDWTGLDGYNWGLNPANPDRWRNFNELYSATYQRIVDTIAPDKPMLIGEMGSTEQGGSKAAWIEEALSAIPTYYSQIRGMLWFDTYDDGMDWPIETSASSASAFASAIQSPAYVSTAEPEAAAGPIEPPESPLEPTPELTEPAS